ncbi:hypothetical protein CRM22_009312 [Opisthorchis felineus]|uniref:Cadherin domain-containing protein n=1 Tax=Opisthorchis felineus TaxID=147828 RepID=A0A4S2LF49_OPIFE|nr:hypothetical protein CRM22_009312 [Opisthorchis felineus]
MHRLQAGFAINTITLIACIELRRLVARGAGLHTVCVVSEECAIGTVVCDMSPLLKDFGIDVQTRDDTREEAASDRGPLVTIISDSQTFSLVGTNLVTRGRVDREHYLTTKQCRMTPTPYEIGEPSDREEQANQIMCVITLELAVLRSRDETQPTFVHIPVRIEDINDNAPRFDQHTSGLWLQVDEDIASDSDAYLPIHQSSQMKVVVDDKNQLREVAILPLAIDVDYGFNGTVSYNLEGTDAKAFELDYGQSSENSDVSHSNSRISLDMLKRLRLLSRTELNHETKTEHHFLLVARDNCETESARHSTQLPIFILVREVNEYAPQFNLGVSEADKQNNHPDLFRDMARYHSSVLLECLENSSSNSFPKLAIDIPENMPVGSRIYRVVATDKDVYMDGDAGKKVGTERRSSEYSLASATDLKVRRYFRVGTTDGWITLIHQMDYETGPKMFEFQIIATDAGRPARTSTLGIIIRTTDVNDEAPIVEIRGITPLTKLNTASPGTLFGGSFASRFHILTVKENLPSWTFVAKISASDRDKGPAGEVACWLDEPPVMMMKTPADQTSFENTLGKQTAFLLKPVSSKEITTSLNAPSSTFAADVNPTGRRSADYVLVTNRLLDREEQEVYLLAVICHDHGDSGDGSSGLQAVKLHEARRLSSTSLVKIFVLDENDNGPRFVSHNQNIQVPENTVHGTRLIQLKSVDKDAPGPGSQTLYRFAGQNDLTGQNNTDFDGEIFKNYFEIEESTGWIRAGKLPLDRETHDAWRIPVVAFDAEFPNRTSLAWVNVKVSDVNDNAPRLVSNTTFWIEEEMGSGPSIANYQSTWYTNRQIFVGHLKAEDADLNDNGRVTFILPDSQSIQNHSACNLRWFLRSDGNLFVYPGANATIDREQQNVYFLPVVLRDHGINVSLSFSTTLTVKVLDKNDNAPNFIRPPSNRIDSSLIDQTLGLPYQSPGSMLPVATLRLPEATSPGTVVYTALATDPDESENGRVVYALEVYLGVWQLMNSRKPYLNQTNMSSNNRQLVIDRNSGEIRLNQRIHASDLKRPDKFVIFAEDCGTPARQSYAFLHVEIESELAGSVERTNSGLTKLVNFNEPAVYNESDKGRRNKLSSNPRPEEHMHTGTSHVPLVTERRGPGLRLVDNPPYKRTAGAIITWNSELVTGLGIGLLIVILLCLLLLVTYALHGTKLVPNRLRRPAGSTHGFKLGKMPIRTGIPSDTKAERAKRISPRCNQGKLHGIHKALGSVFNSKSPHNRILHFGVLWPETKTMITKSVDPGYHQLVFRI